MVIVDTSVWIPYFNRRHSEVKSEVDWLIDEEEALVVGMVLTELIQGTRSGKERKLIKEALLGLPYFEVTTETWLLGGEIATGLLRQGITVATVDLLIAAIAQQHDWRIYTFDTDFQRIPHLRLYTPTLH